MRRSFSPLIGLLMAAALLAAVPAAFAAAPDRLPFIGSSAPGSLSGTQATPTVVLPGPVSPADQSAPTAPVDSPNPSAMVAGVDRDAPIAPTDLTPEHDRAVARPSEITAPDVRDSIRAECLGSVDDSGNGSVECNWKGREDLRIAGWQLWNVQARPAHGERNLVAELRFGVTSYIDAEVEAPGQYLYVVLGLDANGEVIAKSGVAPATMEKPSPHDDPMRLECSATDSLGTDALISCEWSPTRAETAVGYALWRSTGDDRMMVARTGLDVVRFVDTDVAVGQRYVYVITAVDADGGVVGRSRPEHAGMPGPMPRPVEVRPMPTPRMAPDMVPGN